MASTQPTSALTRPLPWSGSAGRVLCAALYVAGTFNAILLLTRVFSAVRAMVAPHALTSMWRYSFPDSFQLYAHAVLIRSGARLYWPWPDFRPNVLGFGLYPVERMPYPPFLTPALAPLLHLSGPPPSGGLDISAFPAFAVAWLVVLLGCTLLYAACLARLASGAASLRGTAHWLLLLLAFPPIGHTILYGNVDPVLWALTGLGLVAGTGAGAAFAGVALVKLWGVWPLAIAWRRHGSAVLAWAGLTVAAAATVSAAVLGVGRFVQALVDWLHYMLPVVSQGFSYPKNLSLSFAALRLAGAVGWLDLQAPLPALARVWLTVAGIAAPLAAAWALRRASARLQLSGTVAASVLFSPVCWPAYLGVLYVAAAVLTGERRRQQQLVDSAARAGTRSGITPGLTSPRS